MRLARKYQRILLSLLFLSFIVGIVLGISLITETEISSGLSELFGVKKTSDHNEKRDRRVETEPQLRKAITPTRPAIKITADEEKVIKKSININSTNSLVLEKKTPKTVIQLKSMKMEIRNDEKNDEQLQEALAKLPVPNYNAHVFYYPWYGNPKVDGNFIHWNHKYLPHWDKQEMSRWPKGKHKPPDDIGSNFYPELGPYSSRDAAVLENHMQQIRVSGAGVLAVSWYPPGMADENGLSWDDLMKPLMDHAHRYQLKVCFHIEPYKERSSVNLRANLEYIVKTYGDHPAFYNYERNGKHLPLYYIYDSYLVSKDDWARLFKPNGAQTIRGTEFDGLFIGLLVQQKHRADMILGGFDGYYTYFASEGFTYGATTKNWPSLSAEAKGDHLLFIPSVGPGYVDERVRPWNMRSTKSREQGGYYEQSFQAALAAKPPIISITSFNEWHEGTQIERAVPKTIAGFQYQDYTPMEPDYYLSLSQKWLTKFAKQQTGKA